MTTGNHFRLDKFTRRASQHGSVGDVSGILEIAESWSTSVFLKGADGRIKYGNPAFRNTFVANKNAGLGYEMLPSDLVDISRFTDNQVCASSYSIGFSYTIENGNTSTRYFTNKYPIVGSTGQVESILGFTQKTSSDASDLWLCKDIVSAIDAKERLEALGQVTCEVVLQVCDGHTNKRIANNLDISVRSVERHRGEAMKALNAESVPVLARTTRTLLELGMFPGQLDI